MAETDTRDDEYRVWEERSLRLGLDPVRHGRGMRRVIMAADLDEMAAKVGASPLAEPLPAVAPSGDAAREAANITLRDAIVHHVAGLSPVDDPTARDEIDRRFRELTAQAINAPNYTATADRPLIIDATHSIANFGTVRIEPGGYIEISAPCYFRAVRLLKTDGDAKAGPPYQLIVTGTPGTNGQPGTPGDQGLTGGTGSAGGCDCCGGIAETDGGTGGIGGRGADGHDGSPAGDGGQGPVVSFQVDELASTIAVQNIGGSGGSGLPGGRGGKGGTGGYGGRDTWCVAEHCGGGNGGPGGPGGNGGTGGSAGSGGPGGTLVLFYRSSTGKTMHVDNQQAQPGQPGGPGGVGPPGDGGGTPGAGGSQGGPGNSGTDPGGTGATRGPGARGTVTVNPATA